MNLSEEFFGTYLRTRVCVCNTIALNLYFFYVSNIIFFSVIVNIE